MMDFTCQHLHMLIYLSLACEMLNVYIITYTHFKGFDKLI